MPEAPTHLVLTGPIGIFSDLHGDLTSLERLLGLEPTVNQWISNGDLVDANDDWPTVARLLAVARTHRVVCLLGNHEEVLAFTQVASEADARTQQELYVMPRALTVTAGVTTMYCCHATPGRTDDFCSINRASDEDLLEVFAGIKAKLVFWGHTHDKGLRSFGNKRFVNTGHLGRITATHSPQTYAIVSEQGTVQLKVLPAVVKVGGIAPVGTSRGRR